MSETEFDSAPEEQDQSMSRMNRLMIGDVVEYEDSSVFPPVKLEGPIVAFANVEKTYLEVAFGEENNRVLTEDEVRRVA